MELTHIIAGEAKKPLQYLSSCEAVKDKGLKGDRYYYKKGTFNKPQFDPNVRDITIVAYETLAECNECLGTNLEFKDLRRNLVIKEFDYDLLKDRTFKIGTATFKIVRTAPPCRYLSRLLGEDMMKGLKYIGGCRAVILESGIVSVGDGVELVF